MRNNRLVRIFWPIVPILLTTLIIALLLVGFGVSPKDGFTAIFQGAFGDKAKILSVIAFWVQLNLAAIGLVITFTTGLWNIGVEGQITMGAIGASWIALKFNAPRTVLIMSELLIAMIAGAIWGGLVGLLKVKGNVHEIFGGLALNNIANIFLNYLISGPWNPPGGATRGTETFPPEAMLPMFGDSRLSPVALIVSFAAIIGVFFLLKGTFFGLKLKALGKNPKSAYMCGVPTKRDMIIAFMICGALAGLCGGIRVTSWYDNLRQVISGGIGNLALLVVLLAGSQTLLVPFVSFFFSAVLHGGIILQLRTQLHSALSSILMAVMVLLFLLLGNYSQTMNFLKKKREDGKS